MPTVCNQFFARRTHGPQEHRSQAARTTTGVTITEGIQHRFRSGGGKPILQKLSLLFALLILGTHLALAQVLRVPFEEVAQTADLIFIGTVDTQTSRPNDKKSMVLTDVFFKDVVVVHKTERSVQLVGSTLRLTYAGGTVGKVKVEVSETPHLVPGHRYLIFLLDDGQTYANPIIGGHQGLFEVVKDSQTGVEYVLNNSGRALTRFDADGIRVSERKVRSIQAGEMVAEDDATNVTARINRQSATPSSGVSRSQPLLKQEALAEQPLKLGEFVRQLRDVTLKAKLENRRISRDGVGFFYRLDAQGKVQAERLRTAKPPVRLTGITEQDRQSQLRQPTAEKANAVANEGQALVGVIGVCGHHPLNLFMEQIPTTWWEYGINSSCMNVWNQAMDIFRSNPDDGGWGDNSQNEFAGYPSNQDVIDQYGFGWSPNALAMTITTTWQNNVCGEIQQSDICWNPAYDWTDNFDISYKGTALLLRTINMHELGHAWGLQIGSWEENYDYNILTVMHGYYYDLVEDGWGIHSEDAYMIRRNYQDQRSINTTFRDVGIESYYADGGLHASTTDATIYKPGQDITLNNVMVENMSYNAVSDLRVRLYLSTDKVITPGDYQLGGGEYWYWTSFCGECFNQDNYTTSIPANVPPGTYYVGAIVTINGYNSDDLPQNNVTFFNRTITVTCANTFSMSSVSKSFSAAGGNGSVTLQTAGSACPATATSSASWLVITSGATGTGTQTINYTVAANPGISTRTATITAGGVTHTVTQAACTVTVASSTAGFTRAGGQGSLQVTTTCSPWTAISQASWIKIVVGASGSGSGTVSYAVDPNLSSSSRAGTIAIADKTVTITQEGNVCSVTPIAFGQTINGQLHISDCYSSLGLGLRLTDRYSFTAAAGQPIAISLTSSAFNSYLRLIGPNGAVIAVNDDALGQNARIPDSTRYLTVSANGTYIIEVLASPLTTQLGNYSLSLSTSCQYTLSKTNAIFRPVASSGSFTVATTGTCAWTAKSNASWITVTSGATGTGNGTVTFSIAANSGTAGRTGTITIAGQTFTVTQQGKG